MFKMISTLIRSQSHDTAEAFTDANAISILRQQLRDAAEGLAQAKKAVAVVIAYQAREMKHAERLSSQLSDLEERALDAIRQEREELAGEAAAAMADTEAELASTEKALAHYREEISELREQVSLSEQRLRNLQRGKQIADATERTQKLRGTMPTGVHASLREAETTLERLQSRQRHAEEVEFALLELNKNSSASSTVSRLAAAGCGDPLKTDVSRILERLRCKIS
ncbi:PspA/IM30 family protein [Labrenzia sp. CE80]|uniref:PspA/IM30 family protein n=1 Tax=Labrenzia sp. CE80 TaxID=1788986 RepID=UPI0013896468|nr:PspA/IM30 family protein [Labrenzia sp. CE80]